MVFRLQGNAYIQRDILKEGWAFSGFIVSDWGSVKEMVAHGYASDLKASAEIAIHAGCDMDMESRAYHKHLKELVEEGVVDIKYVDEAVKRILLKKFQLGLLMIRTVIVTKSGKENRIEHPSQGFVLGIRKKVRCPIEE